MPSFFQRRGADRAHESHDACRSRRSPASLSLLLVAAVGGCSVLDATNPNAVVESALDTPAAATPLANGLGSSVTRALAAVWTPYAAATDEFSFIGTREAYRNLDNGFVSDPVNEFTDEAFPEVAEARFLAVETVRRLEAFDAEGQLRTRNDLARSYLYGAIIFTTIADVYDDFVIAADRREAGAPIGENAMLQLYDTAATYATNGLAIATATGSTTLQAQLLGMRARARFSKGVWQKVKPARSRPAIPFVDAPEAAADARAALALMGSDALFSLTPVNGNPLGFPVLGDDINQRRELRVSSAYADIVSQNPVATLLDPVTNIVDPVLQATLARCCTRAIGVNVPMTFVSSREMRLIIAEVALAQGDVGEFVAQINAIRALNPSLTPYDGASPAPAAMLEHTRRVNLFLQGRRLMDHYRFGSMPAEWLPTSTAARTPGCVFPIAFIERQSNLNTQQPATALPTYCE